MASSASMAPSRRRRRCARSTASAGGGSSQRRSSGIGGAPGGQLQGEGGEVGVFDLRRRVAVEVVVRALGPEAVARAGGHTARAALALVGGGLRDLDGFEAGHAAGGVEAGRAAEAAVHHHADALDGETRLGDVGRDHHLAPPLGAGFDGPVLLLGREIAEEGVEVHVVRHIVLQARLRAADLARAGEEDEHIAVRFAQGRLHLRRHGGLDAVLDGLVPVVHVDRVAAALTFDERRVQQFGDGTGVERGAHHEDAQGGPQHLAGLKGEGEAEVGLQVALVKLVEQHGPDALQGGIVLQHAREDAFRDDCNPGLVAHLRVHPHPVAHGLTGLLAHLLRHEAGGGAGRQAPRLQHEDFVVAQPVLAQQPRGDARGLAGTGGGLQHGLRGIAEGGLQVWQDGVDRKVRHSGLR